MPIAATDRFQLSDIAPEAGHGSSRWLAVGRPRRVPTLIRPLLWSARSPSRAGPPMQLRRNRMLGERVQSE